MAAFANQIGENPVFLPKLEVFNLDCYYLGPTQTASNEHGQYGAVTHILKSRPTRCSNKLFALFSR
jgi:hypothetical protein